MQPQPSIYKKHHFPSEIISHVVWIYYRLNASLRDTSQALSYRGLDINHEIIQACVLKFGPFYGSGLRKRQPQRGDKWHLKSIKPRGSIIVLKLHINPHVSEKSRCVVLIDHNGAESLSELTRLVSLDMEGNQIGKALRRC